MKTWGGRKSSGDAAADVVEGTPEQAQAQAEATATNRNPTISLRPRLKKFRTNRIRQFRFLRKKEDASAVSFSTGEYL